MSAQTKIINATTIAVALSSAFFSTKYFEYKIKSKKNDDFISELNSMSSRAKLRWNNEYAILRTEANMLAKSISDLKESEDARIHTELENERIKLHKSYELAIVNKVNELEEESKKSQENLSTQLESSKIILQKIKLQLEEFLYGRRDLKKLEHISQMLIEDNVGEFNNCYSIKKIRKEFNDLLPLVRDYSLFDYGKISVFRYFMAKNIANLMFLRAPICRFDVIYELNSLVEKGDLHRALFLFDNLRGWPRLILKDWAEKCRSRLEFVEEIKSQIYLNKM